MASFNIALVGCGGRGTGAASNCLASTKAAVKIVAMADAFSDRLTGAYNALLSNYGTKVDVPVARRFVGIDAYRAAIDLADLVVLATPPGFYPEHLAYAISKGKHVFMEKPVAVDSPGIRQVLDSARAADLKKLSIGVGLNDRHQDGMIQTIARLQAGDIGKLLFARGTYESSGGLPARLKQPGETEMIAQIRNWYYQTWLSGDHIVEQNVHVVSNVCWAKNSYPISCQGSGGRQVRTGSQYGQIFDHHAVEFEFADGFRFFNRCRQMAGAYSSVGELFVGDRGRCTLRKFQITGEKPWTYSGVAKDPYQAEIDALLDSIIKGTPYNEAYHGAYATLAAIMGRMASYTGRVITWEEALNSDEDLAPEVRSLSQTPPVVPDSNGFLPIAVPGDGFDASISSPTPGGGVTLRFQGVAGATFQPESAPAVEGPWTSSGPSFVSTGNEQWFTNLPAENAKRFYRFRKIR